MIHDKVPVLWICGPSGVGKTTAAWRLFTRLTDEVAYVDIDQLGIISPDPPGDRYRYRVKSRNLDAVLANFRDAGAGRVIVSGVIDPVHGPHADLIPNAALTLCRLRADHDVLRQRMLGRGAPAEMLGAALREADVLDRSDFGGALIDTTTSTAEDVIRAIRDHLPPVTPIRTPTGRTFPAASGGAGPAVVWLCGTTGVGKSTIGWLLFELLGNAAFVDLDQIGFFRPGDHRLRAGNLAALRQGYRDAEHLVVVGPVDHREDVRRYTDAMPGVTVTLVRLCAGPDEIRRRFRAGVPPIPGDRLAGHAEAELDRLADEAVARAGALARAGIGDLCVDTGGKTAEESAREIRDRIGWA